MLESGGQGVIVEDSDIEEAFAMLRGGESGDLKEMDSKQQTVTTDAAAKPIFACHTGSVGVAGLRRWRKENPAAEVKPREVLCVVSGLDRSVDVGAKKGGA
jgi:hypothetical protein